MLFIFVLALLVDKSFGITECLTLNNGYNERFEPFCDWNYINFTWPNFQTYQKAVESGRYIPENNAIVGVKYHNDRLYLALPIAKPGAPVTLAWVTQLPETVTQTNPLLTPYPSWQMNLGSSCDTLQNVQSMEIDRKGIMWVLDGRRVDSSPRKCPPKIVLLDLKYGGRVIQSYVVPNEVCRHDNCFLNDIVIEELNGGFAYITDTSNDPGLIVFSRQQNRAWKVRHPSMQAQNEALNFVVHGTVHDNPTPIDGIAMTRSNCLDDHDRTIYYTSLVGINIYSIKAKILRNEQIATSKMVGKYITDEGRKPSGPADGLMLDSEGFMFYGALTEDAVYKWNIRNPLNSSILVDRKPMLLWPDSFGFDTFGTLYLVTNNIETFLRHGIDINNTNFRVVKLYTGTCSYQF